MNGDGPIHPTNLCNIKAALGGYQGRVEPERRLHDWFSSAAPGQAYVLWGLGGSGKSTLARTFATRFVESAEPGLLRLVFQVSASAIDQGYAKLLGVLTEVRGGASSVADVNSLKPEEVRGRVHAILRSADLHGKWLCVLDDLPPPAAQTMAEAGLDWLMDDFPWAQGRAIITTRAAD